MPQSPRGAKALALCLRLQRPTVMPATGPAGLRAPSGRGPHTRSPVSPSRPTSRRTCACRSGRKWWPSHLLRRWELTGCCSRCGAALSRGPEGPGQPQRTSNLRGAGGGPHLLELGGSQGSERGAAACPVWPTVDPAGRRRCASDVFAAARGSRASVKIATSPRDDRARGRSRGQAPSTAPSRSGEGAARHARTLRQRFAGAGAGARLTPPRTARYDQRSNITHAPTRSCIC